MHDSTDKVESCFCVPSLIIPWADWTQELEHEFILCCFCSWSWHTANRDKKTLVGFHQRFSRAPQKMDHKGHRYSLHSSIQAYSYCIDYRYHFSFIHIPLIHGPEPQHMRQHLVCWLYHYRRMKACQAEEHERAGCLVFFCLKDMQSACTPLKNDSLNCRDCNACFWVCNFLREKKGSKVWDTSHKTGFCTSKHVGLRAWFRTVTNPIETSEPIWCDLIWLVCFASCFLIGSFSWSCRTCISKVSLKKIALQKLEFGSQKVISQNKSRLFLACEFCTIPQKKTWCDPTNPSVDHQNQTRYEQCPKP